MKKLARYLNRKLFLFWFWAKGLKIGMKAYVMFEGKVFDGTLKATNLSDFDGNLVHIVTDDPIQGNDYEVHRNGWYKLRDVRYGVDHFAGKDEEYCYVVI